MILITTKSLIFQVTAAISKWLGFGMFTYIDPWKKQLNVYVGKYTMHALPLGWDLTVDSSSQKSLVWLYEYRAPFNTIFID